MLSIFVSITDNLSVNSIDTADKFHIVLDAGHGGRDGGAFIDGAIEAVINLEIVYALEKELTSQGFVVSLTRETSESLSSPYASNKKVDDMNKRREKIKSLSPDLVISIHQNTNPLTSVNGLMCYYANETQGSKEYAEVIQNQFNNSGFPFYKSIKATDFNLVEHSPCPAILIECGFLSNEKERKLLQSQEYQQILAFNISQAIMSIMNQGGNK